MIAIELLIGWLIADALSGLYHYILDTKGDAETPIVGPRVIYYSREHHSHPLRFAEWAFLPRHLYTWIIVAVSASAWWFLAGWSPALASATLAGAMSPSIHYWAHRPSLAPSWVRWLQGTGMLQSPKHHSRHHAPPYHRNYCVVSNWTTDFLNGMR